MATKMAEDKKTDDYTIEMDKLDQGNKSFEPVSHPQARSPHPNSGSLSSNPILPVIAYCGSSILMTVMNKYVLSGTDFNLNFFLLLVQVCSILFLLSKRDSYPALLSFFYLSNSTANLASCYN